MNKIILVSIAIVVVASLVESVRGSRMTSALKAQHQQQNLYQHDDDDEDTNNSNRNELSQSLFQQQQRPYMRRSQGRREKRRLQDVEKLMIEDEVLSYLVCDVCDKYKCEPKYCRYCSPCFKYAG